MVSLETIILFKKERQKVGNVLRNVCVAVAAIAMNNLSSHTKVFTLRKNVLSLAALHEER